MVQKDKEWIKHESKWQCKVGICIVTYYAKWLLAKHLKEVHGLIVEKAKPRRPSTYEGGPQHHNHAKMNVRILGNVMVVQRRNDQKVVNRTPTKTQCEWDELIIVTKQYPPLPKLTLVKLTSKQLLQVLGLNAQGVGSVPQNAPSCMDGEG
jgi:hypothetical protein